MKLDAVVTMVAAATASLLGVPVNVLVACAAGAYFSFAFGEKVEPRSYMFKMFVACIFFGAAFTALLQATVMYVTEFKVTGGLDAAIGLLVAGFTRFWVPSVIEVIREKQWVSWIPFLNKRGG